MEKKGKRGKRTDKKTCMQSHHWTKSNFIDKESPNIYIEVKAKKFWAEFYPGESGTFGILIWLDLIKLLFNINQSSNKPVSLNSSVDMKI